MPIADLPSVPSAVASAPAAASLVVAVDNVRNAHGVIRVDVCPRARWLGDGCPWHASTPARIGVTLVTVPGVPPGDYGAQAFHDENSNDKLDTGFLGIPKEGVGFSRDAHFVPSSPRWDDAVFTHGTVRQEIRFRLRYLRGPNSPEAWREQHPGE